MTTYIKPVLMLTTSMAMLLLGACSATTSGVAARAKSISAAAPAVSVQAQQPGDASLTCAQLSAQIKSADGAISQANAMAGESRAGNVANQAANAAIRHGVARSSAARGVIAKVPFGGALFNSALNAKSKSDEKKRVQAQNTAQSAAMRRSTLMGIYTGKGCS